MGWLCPYRRVCTLVSWIEGNGYQIIGPNREVYITGGNEQDNESYITEVQFPVTKAWRELVNLVTFWQLGFDYKQLNFVIK